MTLRRESPVRGRQMRLDRGALGPGLMSPVGYQFLLRLAPRIDKVLVPRTNGRLSSAGLDRVGLVTTTGAKSGRSHTQPLALIDDADGLLAIGSNYGRAKHPGWSANLLANPECVVHFRGAPARYRADLLTGEARAAAWSTATDWYAGFDRYRARCAPREIRVFRLSSI